MMSLTARIVILSYNGKEMLKKCLPSIVDAARSAHTPTAVTVLDNCSADDSEIFVRTNYPNVDFVKAPENLVLCSYNGYLAQIKEPIAILLNNDIRVDKDFIDPLVKKFDEDPRAFLVAPRVMSFDGSSIEAVDTRAGFRFGMFSSTARYPGYEANALVPSRTFASGFGAFSREKFLALNGYSSLYLPGIMEDADLCLRAQRAGDSLYYEPSSVVYHMGQASFKKSFSDLKRESLAHRNTFLFMWKNYSGAGFWINHLAWLPIRMLWMFLRGRLVFLFGFFEALSQTFLNRHPEDPRKGSEGSHLEILRPDGTQNDERSD